MSAMAAFAVEPVERLAEREARIHHMAQTVLEWIKTHSPEDVSEAERDVWSTYLSELDKLDADDTEAVRAYFRRGYRMVLFYRNEHMHDAGAYVPTTEAEFDALPDALDELGKRRRAV